jgi:hypothetical protein
MTAQDLPYQGQEGDRRAFMAAQKGEIAASLLVRMAAQGEPLVASAKAGDGMWESARRNLKTHAVKASGM